jgi:hypothetical protein
VPLYLAPVFNDAQFINSIAANGAKLFTYAAGSTTKQNTYTDINGGTPQANPILLDARGEPASPIWLTGGLSYKFVFSPATDSDPPVAPIRTIDNITGINDASITIDQWVASAITPTYVNATQFTLPGDQTSAFAVNRRIKATVTAGTVYGYISASVFGALTTVTVVLDSGVLDSGLSAVSLGLITPDNTSIPNTVLIEASGTGTNPLVDSGTADVLAVTGTPKWSAYATNKAVWVKKSAAANATSTPTLNKDSLGAKKLFDESGAALSIGALKASMIFLAVYDTALDGAAGGWRCVGVGSTSISIPVRQTVLNGPVDTSGLPSFGGATGTTTVTASGTLTVTAANGFDNLGAVNRIGQITNPAWTGLSTNGTMYLFLDIAADGTCTTGSGTLAPNYRWGGADVTTANQFTFNIQEMTGKVGNGATAAQTYRVYVGQVTVAGGVTTAIVWYALMGRYAGQWTATLPTTTTTVTANHNIGIVNIASSQQVKPTAHFEAECTTAEFGYAIGDVITDPTSSFTGAVMTLKSVIQGNLVYLTTGATTAFVGNNAGAAATLTLASWKYRFRVERGW